MNSAHFSQAAHVFHGRSLPEEGYVVGYASIISKFEFRIPIPDQISMVCSRNKKYENEQWRVFPHKYLPEENSETEEIVALYRQLVFALKYEGVNLLVFSQLAKLYDEMMLTQLVNIEPEGQYSRRIWFLIEWISGKELSGKEKLTKRSYIPIIDNKLQYSIEGEKSSRHMVINNLPGTLDFCPLIKKSEKLERYISENYPEKKRRLFEWIAKRYITKSICLLIIKRFESVIYH